MFEKNAPELNERKFEERSDRAVQIVNNNGFAVYQMNMNKACVIE